MHGALVSVVKVEAKAFARWEVKRDKFLTDLEQMLSPYNNEPRPVTKNRIRGT